MIATYERFGLAQFLRDLRQVGRYADVDGFHVLSNMASDRPKWAKEISETIRSAEQAGYRAHVLNHLQKAKDKAAGIVCDDQTTLIAELDLAMARATALPTFMPQLPSTGLGLAKGLNPYTDWTLGQLVEPPRGWLLVLGLDWYPISDLGNGSDWEDYLNHPFETIRHEKDLFWHNTWAWMLNKTEGKAWAEVKAEEASAFMAAQGIGVVFHNLIPYLRPPGIGKSDDRWPKQELRRKAVRTQVVRDLERLRQSFKAPVVSVCTNETTFNALVDAGFESAAVFNWEAHPSRVFHPSIINKRLPFAQVRAALP